jgi:hypothetical protein
MSLSCFFFFFENEFVLYEPAVINKTCKTVVNETMAFMLYGGKIM